MPAVGARPPAIAFSDDSRQDYAARQADGEECKNGRKGDPEEKPDDQGQ
jgi:hypothetical protein